MRLLVLYLLFQKYCSKTVSTKCEKRQQEKKENKEKRTTRKNNKKMKTKQKDKETIQVSSPRHYEQINLGGQCKSLKSTSRLLDLWNDGLVWSGLVWSGLVNMIYTGTNAQNLYILA